MEYSIIYSRKLRLHLDLADSFHDFLFGTRCEGDFELKKEILYDEFFSHFLYEFERNGRSDSPALDSIVLKEQKTRADVQKLVRKKKQSDFEDMVVSIAEKYNEKYKDREENVNFSLSSGQEFKNVSTTRLNHQTLFNYFSRKIVNYEIFIDALNNTFLIDILESALGNVGSVKKVSYITSDWDPGRTMFSSSRLKLDHGNDEVLRTIGKTGDFVQFKSDAVILRKYGSRGNTHANTEFRIPLNFVKGHMSLSVGRLCELLNNRDNFTLESISSRGDSKSGIVFGMHESVVRKRQKKRRRLETNAGGNQSSSLIHNLYSFLLSSHIEDANEPTENSRLNIINLLNLKRSGDYGQIATVKKRNLDIRRENPVNQDKKCYLFTLDRLCYLRAKLEDTPCVCVNAQGKARIYHGKGDFDKDLLEKYALELQSRIEDTFSMIERTEKRYRGQRRRDGNNSKNGKSCKDGINSKDGGSNSKDAMNQKLGNPLSEISESIEMLDADNRNPDLLERAKLLRKIKERIERLQRVHDERVRQFLGMRDKLSTEENVTKLLSSAISLHAQSSYASTKGSNGTRSENSNTKTNDIAYEMRLRASIKKKEEIVENLEKLHTLLNIALIPFTIKYEYEEILVNEYYDKFIYIVYPTLVRSNNIQNSNSDSNRNDESQFQDILYQMNLKNLGASYTEKQMYTFFEHGNPYMLTNGGSIDYEDNLTFVRKARYVLCKLMYEEKPEGGQRSRKRRLLRSENEGMWGMTKVLLDFLDDEYNEQNNLYLDTTPFKDILDKLNITQVGRGELSQKGGLGGAQFASSFLNNRWAYSQVPAKKELVSNLIRHSKMEDFHKNRIGLGYDVVLHWCDRFYKSFPNEVLGDWQLYIIVAILMYFLSNPEENFFDSFGARVARKSNNSQNKLQAQPTHDVGLSNKTSRSATYLTSMIHFLLSNRKEIFGIHEYGKDLSYKTILRDIKVLFKDEPYIYSFIIKRLLLFEDLIFDEKLAEKAFRSTNSIGTISNSKNTKNVPTMDTNEMT